MNAGLFESFCEMLENIPIKAVVRAAVAQREMVEEDLQKKRTERDEYVNSILSFCNFVSLAVRGIYASFPALPVGHCAFYRKIINRLVEAGELPRESIGRFERVFCNALSTALTTTEDQEPMHHAQLNYSFN